jgi:hypothetical protein
LRTAWGEHLASEVLSTVRCSDVDVLGGDGRDELSVQAVTTTSTPNMRSLRIGPARFEVALEHQAQDAP